MNKNFVILNDFNHISINNEGGGESELLFFNVAFSLSKTFNIKIFKTGGEFGIIDDIEYLQISEFKERNTDVIVQRHFNLLIELHKKNPYNNYILWSHDYLENGFSHLRGDYSKDFINEYFKNNNIKIVAVSNFHKNNLLTEFPDVNIQVIYNALFKSIYPKFEEKNIKSQITFASNWAKGLDKILNITKEYYKINKNFKLILLKPSYCEWSPNFNNYPYIEIIGNIKNKNEYSKILSESICVLTTSYPETFGCVFAEALHLGTPVLADSSISAGFHEFISNEFKVNFNNIREIINKIEQIRLNRPNVNLPLEFYENSVINEWKNIFV
jgi:hypothetical protein